MTKGKKLIKILEKEGPIEFMACLGFQFDKNKRIFYTSNDFGANWLVDENESFENWKKNNNK